MAVETYITFGPAHNDAHPAVVTEQPLSNGYVTIESPNRETARLVAEAFFGKEWAFDYDHHPEPRFAPAGELARVAWIDGPRRQATAALHEKARELTTATYDAAEGDSNDDEIEALQAARDMLELLLDEGRVLA